MNHQWYSEAGHVHLGTGCTGLFSMVFVEVIIVLCWINWVYENFHLSKGSDLEHSNCV